MTLETRKYDFIDSLRGYAILGVLLVHSTQFVTPTSSILQLIATSGSRGVQLFYIASALTLCMSWQFRSTHEIYPIRNFFLRRFFRIAPMFYIAIIYYVFFNAVSPRYFALNGIPWWSILLTALFLHGFHPDAINSVVPGGWSVAVEMNFYCVLPLLMLNIKTTKSLLAFFIFSLSLYALSKYALGSLLLSHYPPDQQYLVSEFTSLNFFAQLPVFVIGMLTHFIFKNPANLRRIIGFGWLILISATVSIFLLRLGTKVISSPIFFGFGFALFALTISIYPVRLLVNKTINRLGKYSYSMYLTHFAVLAALSTLGVSGMFGRGNVSSILFYLCTVAVTATLSFILYSTIERQGIMFGKRIIDWLERSAAANATDQSVR